MRIHVCKMWSFYDQTYDQSTDDNDNTNEKDDATDN